MSVDEARTQRLADLDIDAIEVVANVRLDLRELEDLAGSIRQRGILQPLVVVPSEDGERCELLIGHRRLAAAKLAGLTKVPCLLRPRDTEAGRVLDQLTENVHRDDITPLEKARALQVLRDEGLTHAQIAQRMRKSDQWVKNLLRILTLPECVQRGVHLGWITVTRAIDIPQAYFKDAAAVERLEQLLARHGKEGLQRWYQIQYSLRDKAEFVAEGREAAPERAMSEDEAAVLGRQRWEEQRREQRDAQLRARAYNLAAQRLISMHNEAFVALYEAILEGLRVAA